MAATVPQSYANHTRIVPAYHMVAFPILVVNLLWCIYQLWQIPSVGTIVSTLVAIALLILFFCARLFALTVQDRVIRLEMRLRLERLLPREQHAHIDKLSIDQIVALRFASDEELPGLFRRVLEENIGARKQIKQMIRTWTGDHLRV
jgi:hypothetical protein